MVDPPRNRNRYIIHHLSAFSNSPPAASRAGQFAFTAPAAFVGAPCGAVGHGFVEVFSGQDAGRQNTGFLERRDVHEHAVVDVGGVQRFLGDELGNRGWGRSASVFCGPANGIDTISPPAAPHDPPPESPPPSPRPGWGPAKDRWLSVRNESLWRR